MSKKIRENIIIIISLPILLGFAFMIGKFSILGFASIASLIVGSVFFFFILKNPFLGLQLTIFSLPFERIPTYDIGPFTLKLDQIFAGMTLISWLLRVILSREKIQPYRLTWPLILFLFFSFVSVLLAVDFSRAISVYIFVVFMVVVSFLTVNIVNSKEKMEKIIKIFLLSALITCLFGLYQFLGDVAGLPLTLTGLKESYSKAILGFPRIQAFSMEPLYFANFLFIPLGLAMAIYSFKDNSIITRSNTILLILLILINIILGISRGAYVGLSAMILFFLIFLVRKTITVKNFIATISISLVLGFGAYGFLSISNPGALDSFIEHAKVSDFSQGESVQKRLQDYDKAIIYWQESPIIGIGPGNYGPRYLNYPSHENVTDWQIVNNEYIEILAETGVVGLLLFIIIILAIFVGSVGSYFRTRDPKLKMITFGLLAAFVAIFVQYNFFSTLYIMHIWILIGLMIAMQNIIYNTNKQVK